MYFSGAALQLSGKRLTLSKCCLTSKQAKPVHVRAGVFGAQRAGQFIQRSGKFLMQCRSGLSNLLGEHFAHALARTFSIPPHCGCPLSLQHNSQAAFRATAQPASSLPMSCLGQTFPPVMQKAAELCPSLTL